MGGSTLLLLLSPPSGAIAPPGPGFSQVYIIAVNKPLIQGRDVHLSWTSKAPPGTPYQVYINGKLSWYGLSTSCRVPLPSTAQSPLRFDLGTVLPSEITTDFSASLPSAPKRRATLSWQGGSILAPDIAGFKVYGSDAPGGAIDFGKVLATIAAYPGGIVTDGFGIGGFGNGGFGGTTGTYTWESGSLTSGTWQFAVVPFDSAGNQGTAATTSFTVAVPPLEVPVYPGTNDRLRYTLASYGQGGFGAGGFGAPEVTLTWLPSPG